jgi:Ca-activated chloride channel family protein
MFRFASPDYLYLLFLIPVFIGLHIYWYINKRKKIAAMGNAEMIQQLMPMYSSKRLQIKFYLTLSALLFCILLLARPQFGSKLDSVKRKGVEVIVAMDVSNSMMAQDIEPNRLEKSKMLVTKLIDDFSEDKIGLIVFAGDAYTQIPITSDYISAKMFMPSISPSMIPTPGTAIGTAIDMAIHSFAPQGKGKIGRTIVVITDGENHEDDAVEAAKAALKEGITVNVIGMGRPEGAPIPVQGTMSFKKDKAGNVVVSKLDENMCQEIAKAGEGIYVRADNSNSALKTIQKQLEGMAKADVESKLYSDYSEHFQIFAGIVLVLLLLEVFIIERKNKWLNKIKLFE